MGQFRCKNIHFCQLNQVFHWLTPKIGQLIGSNWIYLRYLSETHYYGLYNPRILLLPSPSQIGRISLLREQVGFHTLGPFAFNKKVYIIKYLARKNEIRLNLDDMIRKKKVKKALSRTTSMVPSLSIKRKGKTVLLPYLPLSLMRSLRYLNRLFWNQSITPVSKLVGFCPMARTPLPLNRNVVFISWDAAWLPCSLYWRVRIGDHVDASFDNKITKSPFAKHLLIHSHSSDEERLLHHESKYK